MRQKISAISGVAHGCFDDPHMQALFCGFKIYLIAANMRKTAVVKTNNQSRVNPKNCNASFFCPSAYRSTDLPNTKVPTTAAEKTKSSKKAIGVNTVLPCLNHS